MDCPTLGNTVPHYVGLSNCSISKYVFSRVPTTEEIANSCRALAEKLCADAASRTDVKLALVDVLDEALQGSFLC